MRLLRVSLATSFALALIAGASVVACSGNDEQPATTPDASAEASDDAQADTQPPPTEVPDADQRSCTLDNGNDPVGLCIQKLVIQAEHDAVVGDGGVAPAWDSRNGSVSGLAHDFHDDVAYGATLANYYSSSVTYGDNEALGLATGDMLRLAPLVEKELATLPDEYGGELYMNLRAYAAGLRYVNDNDDAAKIDAIADAYGKAIYDKYFHPLSIVINAGDGGADDAGDAAAGDAGTGDAGDAGSAFPDGMIGTLAQSLVNYDTEDAATGALALMDMALRHTHAGAGADAGDGGDAGDPDAPNAPLWQAAARSTLDHLFNRARHPQLGLYYCKLIATADPDHDQLQMWPDPPDMIETDEQAAIALALIRAQDLVKNNATVFPAFAGVPLEAHGEDIFARLNGTPSFWDTTALPTNDAGSGYFEGYLPSSSKMLTTKTIRANALLLAALHRANFVTATHFAYQINALRSLFLARTPHKSSFLTQVPDQTSYLPRTTADFDIPPDDAGAPPPPSMYTSASNHVACEGLNEQWYGVNR